MSAIGAWTNFAHPVTAEAQHVFEKARITGVEYVPFAFATQVVAGTNYSFLCTSQVVAPHGKQGAAKVYIFAPLPGQGEPHVTKIEPISAA